MTYQFSLHGVQHLQKLKYLNMNEEVPKFIVNSAKYLYL